MSQASPTAELAHTGQEDPVRLVQLGAEWVTENVGGANRYTEGLARALAGQGVHQRWVVMANRPIDAGDGLRIDVAAAPDSGLRTRLRAVREAWPELAAGADVATSHFALYAHAVRDQLRRMPHVVHFHGPWADESKAEGANALSVWLKRRLERGVYRTGDRFVTLSRAFADVLAGAYGVDPERIRVIPGGVDVDRFDSGVSREEARGRLGWPSDRPIILCVRRVVRRVGLEPLIDAMTEVKARRPDALLMVAGKGPLADELRERVDRANLNGSVNLLGFVPDAELPLAYRAANLSVVPSQSLEGFGLIIPESLASGTPAFVTPVGGMPEVVSDLSADFVLSDRTPGAIAEGILAAVDSRGDFPSDDACQAYARDRFSWPVIGGRILEVYREAVAERG